MKLHYLFLPEKKVMIKKMSGLITYSNLKESILYTWKLPGYDNQMNALLDYRDAEILLNPAELSAINKMMVEEKDSISSKIALLVTKPFETALAMIFEAKISSRQETNIFGDLDSVLNYLDISLEDFNLIYSDKAGTAIFDNQKHAKQKNPGHSSDQGW